jgi:imidazolonepropionase
MHVDRLFTDLSVATMDPARPGLGEIRDAVIAVRDGLVAWVGPAGHAPRFVVEDRASLGGRWVTPGFVDCHTHLVHAGDRSGEFERRLAGESYADIARSGGGIASTVAATRAASEDDLVATALPRLDALIAEGVTTVEIKSGYGLDLDTELRQLRAAKRLANERRVRVAPTYLGAHAVPKDRPRAEYLRMMVEEAIPRVAAEGLAEAVDAFMEGIAFDGEETAAVFRAAAAHGLRVKLHADQLTNGRGAALAARHRALSADHLEYTDARGVAAMAKAGTVAVILPGAFLMLGETRKPPIARFRAAGVPMAVATDLNPGSAPIASLRASMTFACVLFGMTVEEVLLGVTRNAAKALGHDDTGAVAPGMRADLAVWSVDRLAELVAKIGPSPLRMRVVGGA